MEKIGWNDEFMKIKLGSEVSRESDVMRFLYALVKANIQEMNKIIDWINQHEKYVQPLEKAWEQAVEQVLEQAKEKQGA